MEVRLSSQPSPKLQGLMWWSDVPEALLCMLRGINIKNARAVAAERLTCALPDSLLSSVFRWQRYDKIPKPPNDFGKK